MTLFDIDFDPKKSSFHSDIDFWKELYIKDDANFNLKVDVVT